jgi:hypothetical protein
MSFDWLAFKVMCRVTDHYSCHLIIWHSKSGAVRDSAPDEMPTNQITLTMIHDSAPGFE